MTSLVLVAPVRSRGRHRGTWGANRLLWFAGVAVVMLGMFGSVVWALGYSPLGFDRLSLDGGARSVTLNAAGEYVVYEQRVGDDPPLLTTLVVQSDSGERIVTQPSPSGDGASMRRDLPMFAAWEVARFTVTTPGTYSVYAVRATPSEPRPSGTLAVAAVPSTPWLGTWLGLAVVGVLPALIGAAMMATALRRSRADAAH
jgi:hypothetical protein